MTTVTHSTCKKCGKAQHVAQLKKNPDSIGLVCDNEVECKARVAKNVKIAESGTEVAKHLT